MERRLAMRLANILDRLVGWVDRRPMGRPGTFLDAIILGRRG
jgi:hypothetical protein